MVSWHSKSKFPWISFVWSGKCNNGRDFFNGKVHIYSEKMPGMQDMLIIIISRDPLLWLSLLPWWKAVTAAVTTGKTNACCYYQGLGMNNLQPLSVTVMKNYEAVQDGGSLLSDLQDIAILVDRVNQGCLDALGQWQTKFHLTLEQTRTLKTCCMLAEVQPA